MIKKQYTKTKRDAITRSDITVNSFLLCSFFGFLGIHSFYNGRNARGWLQFFTLGGLLIWNFIDLYLILTEKFLDRDGKALLWGKGLNKYYAGFKIRFCAKILDSMLMVLSALVCIICRIPVLSEYPIIITAIYYTFTTASSAQATLGKRLVGIYVVTKSGNRLSLAKSFARYICYFYSCSILFIGFFMTGWTKNKTALHDIIMGTYVIYGKPKITKKNVKKSSSGLKAIKYGAEGVIPDLRGVALR